MAWGGCTGGTLSLNLAPNNTTFLPSFLRVVFATFCFCLLARLTIPKTSSFSSLLLFFAPYLTHLLTRPSLTFIPSLAGCADLSLASLFFSFNPNSLSTSLHSALPHGHCCSFFCHSEQPLHAIKSTLSLESRHSFKALGILHNSRRRPSTKTSSFNPPFLSHRHTLFFYYPVNNLIRLFIQHNHWME